MDWAGSEPPRLLRGRVLGDRSRGRPLATRGQGPPPRNLREAARNVPSFRCPPSNREQGRPGPRRNNGGREPEAALWRRTTDRERAAAPPTQDGRHRSYSVVLRSQIFGDDGILRRFKYPRFITKFYLRFRPAPLPGFSLSGARGGHPRVALVAAIPLSGRGILF